MGETRPRKGDGGQEGVVEGDTTELGRMGKHVDHLLFSAVVVRAQPEMLEVGSRIGGLSEVRDPFWRQTVDFEGTPSV